MAQWHVVATDTWGLDLGLQVVVATRMQRTRSPLRLLIPLQHALRRGLSTLAPLFWNSLPDIVFPLISIVALSLSINRPTARAPLFSAFFSIHLNGPFARLVSK